MNTRLGATYEEVAAAGMGGYGESPIFYAQGGDPWPPHPTLPGPLIGLESFSLHPIPEPKTVWLFAVGLGILGLFGTAIDEQWIPIANGKKGGIGRSRLNGGFVLYGRTGGTICVLDVGAGSA